jgi:RND superfamily putative drug exporter
VFARLGAFAVRFRWFIIAAWVVVAAVLTIVAPNIDDVAVSDQRAFLPDSAPSLTAHDTVAEYFPERVSPSSAVLVIDAGAGGRVDQGAAADFVESLTARLTAPDAPAAVSEVWSPTLGDEQTRAGLTSADRQIALILVRFDAIGTEPSTKEAMTTIADWLAQAPTGIRAHMTGDAPILGAYGESTKGSVDSTTWITITLVVIILLIIYRSPVSPIIPLLTIGLAYLTSRGVVALLGAEALTISMYTNVFLIVVLFGAGTDYCLFLISRFREEMADVTHPAPAVKITVRAVGETIASSAGTVIVGLALMSVAELGLYNTSGPSIAIGVAIALLAGLTFTPAMLTVLGDRAFWPRKARHLKESGFWHGWAGRVVGRPLVALLLPLIVLVPLAVYGDGLERDFDMLGDLPDDAEARVGFDMLAEHLGPGTMQPLNVVVVDNAGYGTPQGLARTEELHTALAGLDHVAEVRSFMSLLQDKSTLSVSAQLDTVIEGVRKGIAQFETLSATGLGPASGFEQTAEELIGVYGYLTQLAAAYPQALQDPDYQQALSALADLARLAEESDAVWQSEGGAAQGPVGDWMEQVHARLESLAGGLEALRGSFAGGRDDGTRTDALAQSASGVPGVDSGAAGDAAPDAPGPDAILLPDLYLESNADLKALRDAYLSADGTAARLQVVLDAGPYSAEALGAVETIRQTLEDGGFAGGVEGTSAVMLDLRDASNRDMTRAIIFVLGGVFVVLVLLLRALVAPIYLILTILLSYSATLGVVRLLFVDLLGAAGIVWWVPLFMFVMLVALGMDYNIFLIGRVKEEVAASGTRAGTRAALARTGGIITSAGIIMAGTFASMLSSSLMGLLQIGFAVAFGVLLDTFVVRTTLVPALTVLLGRWVWWPRRGPGSRAPG